MGKTVDFIVVFGEGVRKRHYHETEKGKIIYFAVQLEVKVDGFVKSRHPVEKRGLEVL